MMYLDQRQLTLLLSAVVVVGIVALSCTGSQIANSLRKTQREYVDIFIYIIREGPLA